MAACALAILGTGAAIGADRLATSGDAGEGSVAFCVPDTGGFAHWGRLRPLTAAIHGRVWTARVRHLTITAAIVFC